MNEDDEVPDAWFEEYDPTPMSPEYRERMWKELTTPPPKPDYQRSKNSAASMQWSVK